MPDPNREAWRSAGWRIEHTGGGCEALVRYYDRAGDTVAVVLTADLAVPDGPDDEWIDPPGVYIDPAGTDPDDHDTAWGTEAHVEWRRSERTYEGWTRLADTLARMHGATAHITDGMAPDTGAGLGRD